MDDHDLVKQCLNGHSRAFGLLVDRYQRPLYNTALRMVKNDQDAEDVVQSAFLKAYENLATFDPEYRFFSWVYRITVNEALNLVKRRRPTTGLEGEDIEGGGSGEGERAFESNDWIESALVFLSPEERAIVLLKHVEGFSYEEIGFVFEIPLKTVKSRLYSARQRLKDALIKQGLEASHG